MSSDAIVVPLKRFEVAKGRLRRTNGDNATDIARELARGVLSASFPRTVIVVGEDPSIAAFAAECGAESYESDATDLNEAVTNVYQTLSHRFERLIFVHGDLRHPDGLAEFEPTPGVTVVTDHHGTGTNVLVVPTGLDFYFGYGPGSAQHHVAEALRLGVPVNVVTNSEWRFDVDEASDLD